MKFFNLLAVSMFMLAMVMMSCSKQGTNNLYNQLDARQVEARIRQLPAVVEEVEEPQVVVVVVVGTTTGGGTVTGAPVTDPQCRSRRLIQLYILPRLFKILCKPWEDDFQRNQSA